ncbi:MAG: UDP-N-acetylglucosamine 2-epimerase (non-hydrolyzing) [Spirochaetales bacterium]|nr:UDP-N-acetylglucosamine 2-epimerase (non-hydrolyzing) [Spirochaetales bacterium]
MNKIKIAHVVGARPNFIKIAPLLRAMTAYKEIESVLIHTGQHYDTELSDIFFKELEIPHPDIYLGIGSGTHAEQTAKIMLRLEKILSRTAYDLLLLVGDVNSTLAASIVGAKLQIPIAHVEAGLRSWDREMPEEVNRIITDALSTYLFTTSRKAEKNLLKEGIDKDKIHFVGNVMIDTLTFLQEKAESSHINKKSSLTSGTYAVATLHRPSNVDHLDALTRILKAFEQISKSIRIIFPIHPRTKAHIQAFGLDKYINKLNIRLIDPVGYIEFLNLVIHSKFVLTDSGGVQEETTALGIPCLTLRNNTERPITVEVGTNTVVGNNTNMITAVVDKIIKGTYKKGKIPELWDGKTAERIVAVLWEKMS